MVVTESAREDQVDEVEVHSKVGSHSTRQPRRAALLHYQLTVASRLFLSVLFPTAVPILTWPSAYTATKAAP